MNLLYPRNLILRRGLTSQGVSVTLIPIPRYKDNPMGWRDGVNHLLAIADDIDVIVLPEFNFGYAWRAAWLARRLRKRLVIDAFVSLYDSAVYDRRAARPWSLTALRYWLIDWTALHVGDHLLADTAAHRNYFAQQFHVHRDRFSVVPVGASREWFDAPEGTHSGPGCLAQFYGTYIPLHGIQTILEAAAHLRADKRIRFELIGRGQTYAEMRRVSDNLGLNNVTFTEPVTPDLLPAMVARADISLGIFGATDKASRVIPNKVFQTLALRKPVITADTPALREAFTPDKHVLAIPPENSEALADAISSLASDADLRQQLAASGRARMEEAFTEQKVGSLLLKALTEL